MVQISSADAKNVILQDSSDSCQDRTPPLSLEALEKAQVSAQTLQLLSKLSLDTQCDQSLVLDYSCHFEELQATRPPLPENIHPLVWQQSLNLARHSQYQRDFSTILEKVYDQTVSQYADQQLTQWQSSFPNRPGNESAEQLHGLLDQYGDYLSPRAKKSLGQFFVNPDHSLLLQTMLRFYFTERNEIYLERFPGSLQDNVSRLPMNWLEKAGPYSFEVLPNNIKIWYLNPKSVGFHQAFESMVFDEINPSTDQMNWAVFNRIHQDEDFREALMTYAPGCSPFKSHPSATPEQTAKFDKFSPEVKFAFLDFEKPNAELQAKWLEAIAKTNQAAQREIFIAELNRNPQSWNWLRSYYNNPQNQEFQNLPPEIRQQIQSNFTGLSLAKVPEHISIKPTPLDKLRSGSQNNYEGLDQFTKQWLTERFLKEVDRSPFPTPMSTRFDPTHKPTFREQDLDLMPWLEPFRMNLSDQKKAADVLKDFCWQNLPLSDGLEAALGTYALNHPNYRKFLAKQFPIDSNAFQLLPQTVQSVIMTDTLGQHQLVDHLAPAFAQAKSPPIVDFYVKLYKAQDNIKAPMRYAFSQVGNGDFSELAPQLQSQIATNFSDLEYLTFRLGNNYDLEALHRYFVDYSKLRLQHLQSKPMIMDEHSARFIQEFLNEGVHLKDTFLAYWGEPTDSELPYVKFDRYPDDPSIGGGKKWHGLSKPIYGKAELPTWLRIESLDTQHPKALAEFYLLLNEYDQNWTATDQLSMVQLLDKNPEFAKKVAKVFGPYSENYVAGAQPDLSVLPPAIKFMAHQPYLNPDNLEDQAKILRFFTHESGEAIDYVLTRYCEQQPQVLQLLADHFGHQQFRSTAEIQSKGPRLLLLAQQAEAEKITQETFDREISQINIRVGVDQVAEGTLAALTLNNAKFRNFSMTPDVLKDENIYFTSAEQRRHENLKDNDMKLLAGLAAFSEKYENALNAIDVADAIYSFGLIPAFRRGVVKNVLKYLRKKLLGESIERAEKKAAREAAAEGLEKQAERNAPEIWQAKTGKSGPQSGVSVGLAASDRPIPNNVLNPLKEHSPEIMTAKDLIGKPPSTKADISAWHDYAVTQLNQLIDREARKIQEQVNEHLGTAIFQGFSQHRDELLPVFQRASLDKIRSHLKVDVEQMIRGSITEKNLDQLMGQVNLGLRKVWGQQSLELVEELKHMAQNFRFALQLFKNVDAKQVLQLKDFFAPLFQELPESDAILKIFSQVRSDLGASASNMGLRMFQKYKEHFKGLDLQDVQKGFKSLLEERLLAKTNALPANSSLENIQETAEALIKAETNKFFSALEKGDEEGLAAYLDAASDLPKTAFKPKLSTTETSPTPKDKQPHEFAPAPGSRLSFSGAPKFNQKFEITCRSMIYRLEESIDIEFSRKFVKDLRSHLHRRIEAVVDQLPESSTVGEIEEAATEALNKEWVRFKETIQTKDPEQISEWLYQGPLVKSQPSFQNAEALDPIQEKVRQYLSDPKNSRRHLDEDQLRRFVQDSDKTVVTFAGFSGDYADPKGFRKALEEMLDQLDPEKHMINAGATEQGIGLVYEVAKEKGFTTLGEVSNLAAEYGVSRYVDYFTFVGDTWDGASPMTVELGSQHGVFVVIGGGPQSLDEAKAVLDQGGSVIALPGFPDTKGRPGSADDLIDQVNHPNLVNAHSGTDAGKLANYKCATAKRPFSEGESLEHLKGRTPQSLQREELLGTPPSTKANLSEWQDYAWKQMAPLLNKEFRVLNDELYRSVVLPIFEKFPSYQDELSHTLQEQCLSEIRKRIYYSAKSMVQQAVTEKDLNHVVAQLNISLRKIWGQEGLGIIKEVQDLGRDFQLAMRLFKNGKKDDVFKLKDGLYRPIGLEAHESDSIMEVFSHVRQQVNSRATSLANLMLSRYGEAFEGLPLDRVTNGFREILELRMIQHTDQVTTNSSISKIQKAAIQGLDLEWDQFLKAFDSHDDAALISWFEGSPKVQKIFSNKKTPSVSDIPHATVPISDFQKSVLKNKMDQAQKEFKYQLTKTLEQKRVAPHLAEKMASELSGSVREAIDQSMISEGFTEGWFGQVDDLVQNKWQIKLDQLAKDQGFSTQISLTELYPEVPESVWQLDNALGSSQMDQRLNQAQAMRLAQKKAEQNTSEILDDLGKQFETIWSNRVNGSLYQDFLRELKTKGEQLVREKYQKSADEIFNQLAKQNPNVNPQPIMEYALTHLQNRFKAEVTQELTNFNAVELSRYQLFRGLYADQSLTLEYWRVGGARRKKFEELFDALNDLIEIKAEDLANLNPSEPFRNLSSQHFREGASQVLWQAARKSWAEFRASTPNLSLEAVQKEILEHTNEALEKVYSQAEQAGLESAKSFEREINDLLPNLMERSSSNTGL